MTDISKMVAVTYERNRQKPELESFKRTVRISRKFGFPFMCSINGERESEQRVWAAKLLIEVAQSYPCAIPDDFYLEEGSTLFDDAQWLLNNTRINKAAFEKNESFK